MNIWHMTRVLGSLAVLAVLAVLAMLATGCGRGKGVNVYEPGVYKGARVSLEFTPELNARLQERFQMGQTDR